MAVARGKNGPNGKSSNDFDGFSIPRIFMIEKKIALRTIFKTLSLLTQTRI